MRGDLALCLGTLVASSSPAAELCFAPDHQGNNVTADCPLPQYSTYENSWTGFTTDGTPCHSGDGGALTACEAAAPHTYAWTLSLSASDPDENVGEPSGTEQLYLWLRCHDAEHGLNAACLLA
jgi:hypothetical protein